MKSENLCQAYKPTIGERISEFLFPQNHVHFPDMEENGFNEGLIITTTTKFGIPDIIRLIFTRKIKIRIVVPMTIENDQIQRHKTTAKVSVVHKF